MDFDLSAEQEATAQRVSDFAVREIAPGADERDRTAHFPRDTWTSMGEAGLLGLIVPTEYGGSGTDFLTAAVALESFARHGHDLGLSMSLTVTSLICYLQLLQHANDEQKKRWLPLIARGETIPAFAVSERERGSHPRYLKTTAKALASDYVINGRKMYVTNGPVADLVIVFAITERFGDRNGISAFLVEKGTPGFEVGEVMELAFCRSSPHSELVFDNCRVPAGNLIGEKNVAFETMVRGVRETEDSLSTAMIAGYLGWIVELAVDYLKRQGNDCSGERLLLLSELVSIAETARTIARKLAWLRDKKRETSAESALGQFQFHALIGSATKTLKELFPADKAVTDSGLERPLRDLQITSVGKNVAGIRKKKFAEQLLKMEMP